MERDGEAWREWRGIEMDEDGWRCMEVFLFLLNLFWSQRPYLTLNSNGCSTDCGKIEDCLKGCIVMKMKMMMIHSLITG